MDQKDGKEVKTQILEPTGRMQENNHDLDLDLDLTKKEIKTKIKIMITQATIPLFWEEILAR